jgi:hypothetical protein
MTHLLASRDERIAPLLTVTRERKTSRPTSSGSSLQQKGCQTYLYFSTHATQCSGSSIIIKKVIAKFYGDIKGKIFLNPSPKKNFTMFHV